MEVSGQHHQVRRERGTVFTVAQQGLVDPDQIITHTYSLDEVDMEDLIEICEPAAFFHIGAITDTTVDDEREMMEDNTMTFPPILTACAAANGGFVGPA